MKFKMLLFLLLITINILTVCEPKKFSACFRAWKSKVKLWNTKFKFHLYEKGVYYIIGGGVGIYGMVFGPVLYKGIKAKDRVLM